MINILTNRGNDLTDFFFPIFYFVRENILKYHQIPLWNNLFFSGTPLLPDPQSPIFYLPNIIFLIIGNIKVGFVISIILHILASGIGMYLLSRNGFKFSKKTSLFCSLLYISEPKLSGYIEAGHFGLITSWAWLPFAFLSTILLARIPNIKRAIILSITLAGLFYTHILVFGVSIFAICILFFYQSLHGLKNIKYLFLSGIFCFGLIAIALLPQLSWQSQTTRNLLLQNPDVYPKWLSNLEFIKTSISPILFGVKFIWDQDTEKTIALGFIPLVFSLVGFLKLKRRLKFLFLISLSSIILISMNNISPIYDFLIKQQWYVLLRVSTRFWFLVVFIVIYLAGLSFDFLIKKRNTRFLIYVLAILAISELQLTSLSRIMKPIQINNNLVPKEVYEFLSADKSRFRVFCLNRCLSQSESALYGLELADGYGTLQQKNYYNYSQQLAQAFYRNRYTLSIPPFEIFSYENLQPFSPNLAVFNIKYVISNHILKDKNLKLVKHIDKYLIYENKIVKPRSNYPITLYSPNFIQIDTSLYKGNEVLLSEVYNNDWQAFSDNKQLKIEETNDVTREVKIDKQVKSVEFIYNPISFRIGILITLLTIFLSILFFFIFSNKNNNTPKIKDS